MTQAVNIALESRLFAGRVDGAFIGLVDLCDDGRIALAKEHSADKTDGERDENGKKIPTCRCENWSHAGFGVGVEGAGESDGFAETP